MASAQVLKKKDHLEAGKKKLEEFRRKKAAEKAKKATSTGVNASDGLQEKQSFETEDTRVTNVNSQGTSAAISESSTGVEAVVPNTATTESIISSADFNAKPTPLETNKDTSISAQEHSYLKNEVHQDDTARVDLDEFRSIKDKTWDVDKINGSTSQVSYRLENNPVLDQNLSSIEESRPSSHSSYSSHHGLELDNYPSNNINGPEKDSSQASAGTSVLAKDILPYNPVSSFLSDKLGNSSYGDNRLTFSPYTKETREKKLFGAVDHGQSMNHSSTWTSRSKLSEYDSDAQSSSYYAPPSSLADGRRSRPSFLDSIQFPKSPSSSPSLVSATKNESTISQVYPIDGLGSSIPLRSVNSSDAFSDGDPFNRVTVNKHDLFSQKQNEDFAALEQHIEDLTQDKFSLQRSLEASRALAESLASENSGLTDSFNQQGSVVNQLKNDLEMLQEEIKAHLGELQAIKIEYNNVRLECNAADERAKLLASEVIGLEEKALRLRSNELKLERQLETSQAEVSSYRKKLSTLEKDHQDLLSTINALQEEKKVLQSKLWNASSNRKSENLNNPPYSKKDISTSTDDLDAIITSESANTEDFVNALQRDDASRSQSPHVNINLNNLEDWSMAFPSDQMRMIQNINTLLAELALEKDQLTQALSVESSQRSKLLEQNKELTRKLEVQTQRLELLTAQSMASDNIQPKELDSQPMHASPKYAADEGDEVVERVLGWIMKLFPGGPSRRRPIKHF